MPAGQTTIRERLDGIRRRCLELNDSWKEPEWGFLLLQRKNHVVMCSPGKTATVSWMRVLLRLTGVPTAMQLAKEHRYTVTSYFGSYLGVLKRGNATENVAVLKPNYKIMLVRDPLVRLISVYRERMLKTDNKGFLPEQDTVKRMFRPNVSTR